MVTGASRAPASVNAGAGDQAQQKAVHDWMNSLAEGSLSPQGETSMRVGQTYPWTATIVWPQSGSPTPQAGPNAQTIKVSNHMKVLLDCPQDASEFKIVDNGNSDEQFVLQGGTTTWTWNVTPQLSAAHLRLRLRAWVIDDNNDQIGPVQVYSQEITVHVQTVRHMFLWQMEHNIWYWLPGGAGFVFLAGIVAWLWKQRRKNALHAPAGNP